MKKIYYLGFYDDDANKAEKRYFAPSARNKMKYIAETLAKIGNEVTIVSVSKTLEKRFALGQLIDVNDGVKLKKFFSLGNYNIITRNIAQVLIYFSFVCWAMVNIKPGDVLLVYHSLYYMRLIQVLKKVCRFRIVMEVEEIYGDVTGNLKEKKREISCFKCADAFIFSTENLDRLINTASKKSVVIYGAYESVEKSQERKFDDFQKHVVYAGTLDIRKGGAKYAVLAGKYLPENYHIHIIGFGSEQDLRQLEELLEREQFTCKVTYDGCKLGQEYNDFLQSCIVGLSTQNPDSDFNATSFPSKILPYLANGLKVVSGNVSVVSMSKLNEYMFYYNKLEPKEIAMAIENAAMVEKWPSREIITELDEGFRKDILALIEELR